MTSLILFVLLFACLLIGVPIAVSLGLSSAIWLMLFSPDSLRSIALKLYHGMHHYTLLAIPFFILASAFLSTGGVARRIVDFAIAAVGHLRGGMAIAAVFACMIFAAISGSSPATVIAVGPLAIAAMRQAGYTKEFATGVICNAGTLGILIPPSLVMVVYAAATEVSVRRMFMAGVLPGLLAGLSLMVAIYIFARIRNMPLSPRAPLRHVLATARDAFWGLMLIVIVLGGIYGGVFTPTEAAAVSAVYAFVVANFIYRDMGPLRSPAPLNAGRHPLQAIGTLVGRTLWALPASLVHQDTRNALLRAGKVTVMLMFIITNALVFAHVLTTERIPQDITAFIVDLGVSPWMFLVVINLLLLFGGQFMEPSGLIIIVAPLVFPIAVNMGIDPIHLGIIMVVNMEIGLISPPVGLNLFVSSSISGLPVGQVIRAALPWLMILLLFLVVVTYVPAISTFLPNTLFGPEITFLSTGSLGDGSVG